MKKNASKKRPRCNDCLFTLCTGLCWHSIVCCQTWEQTKRKCLIWNRCSYGDWMDCDATNLNMKRLFAQVSLLYSSRQHCIGCCIGVLRCSVALQEEGLPQHWGRGGTAFDVHAYSDTAVFFILFHTHTQQFMGCFFSVDSRLICCSFCYPTYLYTVCVPKHLFWLHAISVTFQPQPWWRYRIWVILCKLLWKQDEVC